MLSSENLENTMRKVENLQESCLTGTAGESFEKSRITLLQGIQGISKILKKRREICMTITLFLSLRDPEGSQNRTEKNTALFNSAHCIERWMSQGLFYNDLLSRKIRAQAETYFLKNLLFTEMVCFAETFLFALFFSGSSFWLHPRAAFVHTLLCFERGKV